MLAKVVMFRTVFILETEVDMGTFVIGSWSKSIGRLSEALMGATCNGSCGPVDESDVSESCSDLSAGYEGDDNSDTNTIVK